MTDAVVIIGSGPAGLAAGACLKERGVPLRILDREGEPGGAYRLMFPGIVLASPAAFSALPGLALPAHTEYVSAGEYAAYLRRYAEHHRLSLTRATVDRVERDGASFVVHADGEALRAPAVIVATGMWSFPVQPDLGTSARVIHVRDFRGPAAHPEERVLVVGGGSSAVEIAEMLARAGKPVVISARSGVQLMRRKLLGVDLHWYGVPLRKLPMSLIRGRCERPPTLPATDLGFSSLRKSGAIVQRPGIRSISGATFRFADGAEETFDLVILATGFRYETPFLPAEVARAPSGHLSTREGESVSWPGLFVIGAPCATEFFSEFLQGVARDAPRIADRLARSLPR